MSGRIENSSGQPDRVKQALENAKAAGNAPERAPEGSEVTVPTPDEISAMTPDEYQRLEDRVRQEAASEGMRLEKSNSPEHHDRPYRLVSTTRNSLVGYIHIPWPWQTLHELVTLMFGEPEPPEIVLVDNTYMSAKMAKYEIKGQTRGEVGRSRRSAPVPTATGRSTRPAPTRSTAATPAASRRTVSGRLVSRLSRLIHLSPRAFRLSRLNPVEGDLDAQIASWPNRFAGRCGTPPPCARRATPKGRTPCRSKTRTGRARP